MLWQHIFCYLSFQLWRQDWIAEGEFWPMVSLQNITFIKCAPMCFYLQYNPSIQTTCCYFRPFWTPYWPPRQHPSYGPIPGLVPPGPASPGVLSSPVFEDGAISLHAVHDCCSCTNRWYKRVQPGPVWERGRVYEPGGSLWLCVSTRLHWCQLQQ